MSKLTSVKEENLHLINNRAIILKTMLRYWPLQKTNIMALYLINIRNYIFCFIKTVFIT